MKEIALLAGKCQLPQLPTFYATTAATTATLTNISCLSIIFLPIATDVAAVEATIDRLQLVSDGHIHGEVLLLPLQPPNDPSQETSNTKTNDPHVPDSNNNM